MIGRLIRLFVVVGLLLVAGCNSTPIAEGVSQTQANQIVALLNNHGIAAQSSRDTGGSKYTVEVRRSYYSQAVSLLTEKGYPREEKLTFNELTAQQGFLPSSREMEALRLDHALAGEVEELLESHPAVTEAKVIVRLNSVKENADSGVSVLVQQRFERALQKEEVADIVARAVPGVQRQNITVSLHVLPPEQQIGPNEGVQNVNGKVSRVPLISFLLGWRVPEDDYNGFALTLIGCFVAMVVVGAVAGYWYGYYHQSKHYFEGEPLDGMQPALKLDKPRRDLTEG